ncbi:hypothetical protein CCACVL1_17360, partial [Corchorus capsularis]
VQIIIVLSINADKRLRGGKKAIPSSD